MASEISMPSGMTIATPVRDTVSVVVTACRICGSFSTAEKCSVVMAPKEGVPLQYGDRPTKAMASSGRNAAIVVYASTMHADTALPVRVSCRLSREEAPCPTKRFWFASERVWKITRKMASRSSGVPSAEASW